MEDKFNPDCSRLKQFLPPEVWNLVASDKLKSDPADLEDLVNSSTFFRDLLASQRTLFLFEEVLPLVASSVWKNDCLEGLAVSDVLNLRGVCSHWSTVVDKLIYEEFQFFEEGSSDVEISVAGAFQSIVENYHFAFQTNDTEHSTESIHKFLRHFEGTHPGNQPKGRNPFIWGSIHVKTCEANVEDDEAYHRFLEGVTQMLSNYGSHLHSFSLYCQGDEFVGDFSRCVREWFLHMPNLKELDFSSDITRWWEFVEALSTDWEFPEFKFLEKLVANELPGPVFNPLIRRNNHISKLVVKTVPDDFDFFTFPLPNLKILHVGQCYEMDVERLRSPQVQWGLETLRLKFVNDNVGVATAFQVIQEKFASTLVYFELKMTYNQMEDNGPLWLDCQKCRLELPNLKQIKLSMKSNPVCLDFLLGMKHNLEEISVTIKYGLPFRHNGTFTSGTIVQFMGFEGKMLESNIWVLFKNLKNVEVRAKWDGEGGELESRWYSREEWMMKNEYI